MSLTRRFGLVLSIICLLCSMPAAGALVGITVADRPRSYTPPVNGLCDLDHHFKLRELPSRIRGDDLVTTLRIGLC
jgi:hypothetical protein